MTELDGVAICENRIGARLACGFANSPACSDTNNDGYPDARSRVYAYDAVRRLSSRLDQQLALTTYSYDFANRLLSRHYPDSMDDSFTYDAASRLLTAYSGRYLNTITRDYSSNNEKAGRLQSEMLTISSQSYTTSYGYAANNLQTSVTYPNGDVVSRTFTPRYQLASVAYNTVAVADPIAYDDGMRKTSTTFGNGRVEGRTYRTDNLSNTIATDGSTTSFTYSWDSNKRKTAETNNLFAAQTNTYGGYDNEDRLTSFARGNGDTQTWALSLAGDWNSTTINNVQQSRTHDNVHELTAINANSLTYDQKGNLTYNGNDGRYFYWDYENRLFETFTWDGDTTVNCYDALGRRVLHQDISNDWMTFNLTVLVSDGLQEIAEYPQGGAATSPKRTYVYGSYIDEPLMMVDYTGEAPAKYYYHANDLYSVAALTDSAGNVVERYKYDPYGKVTILASDGVTIRASSAYNNPWTFTGRRLDAENGLMYYRARMYSPGLGRFVSRDPIGYMGSRWNLYEYCQNNPQFWLDPLGLKLTVEGSEKFRKTVSELLKEICSKASVDDKGVVSVGGPPYDANEKISCCCLAELVKSPFDNKIKEPDPWKGPYTDPDDPKKGSWKKEKEEKGEGTRGITYYNPKFRGKIRKSKEDKWEYYKPASILAHEICGHMMYFNRGTHDWPGLPEKKGELPPQEKKPTETERVINKEHGWPEPPADTENRDWEITIGE